MSDAIITVFEGDPLPTHAVNPRVLLTEEVPVLGATLSRRRYTLLVNDGRFWMTDKEKWSVPLQSDGRPESHATPPKGRVDE